MEHERYRDVAATLGSDLFAKVQAAKVLVVGAGGIGCELLKNLVMMGFVDIETIDLDTIDVSNLNRQFLFQRRHIGLSKAEVARESALNFNPHAKIVAHHGNIKTNEYGPEYFKQFTLVMNALDNLDARRHVNRMCLAADVPLIESGTEGYLGQVTVIKKESTECFDCVPRPTPKTFAVCTIRSSPSKPIHCIVWAKRLFSQIFAKAEEDDAVTDLNEGELLKGPEGAEETKAEESDLALLRHTREQLKERLQAVQETQGPARWLFDKVFHADLELLSVVDQIKRKRQPKAGSSDTKPPQPIRYEEAMNAVETNGEGNGSSLIKDQRVWTLKENAQVFINSATNLYERIKKVESVSFDKDDVDAMDFVTSASNLRSHAFGIAKQSRFDTKAMAGNIIPAIATTNAVISGLIVMEAIKVIDGRLEDCRSSYLLRRPSSKRFLLPAQLEKPNPNCYVCGSSFVQVAIDTEKTLLRHFIEQVLRSHFGMLEPSIMLGFDLLYESGEDAMDFHQQLDKTLTDLRVTHNTVVKVEDILQDLEMEISIVHKTDFEEGKRFEVHGKASIKPHHEEESAAAAPQAPQPPESEDDLIVLSAAPVPVQPNAATKRKREDENQAAAATQKKADAKDDAQEERSKKRRREDDEPVAIDLAE
jgi:ubiquitin-like 1-activating enzyme E1 B